jgi:hypothetical protein
VRVEDVLHMLEYTEHLLAVHLLQPRAADHTVVVFAAQSMLPIGGMSSIGIESTKFFCRKSNPRITKSADNQPFLPAIILLCL